MPGDLDVRFRDELNAEERFLNVFSTIKLHVGLGFDSDQVISALVGLLTEPEPTFDSNWRPAVALIHECTHFWQWIGTTLGFHTTRLTMAQSVLSRLTLKLLDEAGVSAFPVPLEDLPLSKIPPSARDDISYARDMWQCIERYKTALHGYRDVCVGHEEFAKRVFPTAYKALIRFDCLNQQFGDGSATDYNLAESKLADYSFHLTPSRTVSPQLTLGRGVQYSLGGRVLLEGAACCQEGKLLNHLRNLGTLSSADWRARALQIGESFYGTSFALLHENLPRKTSAIAALPYLLDLAFMGLFDPLYVVPFADTIAWRDVHPGHRFLRILNATKELGLPPDESPPDAYLDLVEHICRREQWPTPSALSEQTERFQPSKSELHEWTGPGFFNTNPFFEFRRRHCAAMRTRLANPSLLINCADGFRDLFGSDPTAYNLLRPSVLFADHSGFQDMEMLSFFMFHYLMRCIFVGTCSGLDTEKLLPTGFRPSFQSSKDGTIDDDPGLFEYMVWRKVEFPKERLVPLDEWQG